MVLGQAATLRGLEILKNLGCDIRILQMEGAKDPDEYVIKYGSGRFNILVDEAISLTEFKAKMIKDKYNLENTNDKIKFLNEITKLITDLDNQIEKEIFIEKISKNYKISKEAIYAEVNKLNYAKNAPEKILERPARIKIPEKKIEIDEKTLRRENMIIYLLANDTENSYLKLNELLKVENFKSEINKKIIEKIITEIQKSNYDVSTILSSFEDENIINHLSMIMAEDYQISSVDKCIEDVINSYNKDKLIDRKNEILSMIDSKNGTNEEIANLENELSEIIIKLAKMK